MNFIFQSYRSWLNDIVRCDEFDPRDYTQLIEVLNDVQFYYIVQDDHNRECDGRDLKYEFAFEMGYKYSDVDAALNGWCSVNEMLIALAFRCEHHIMHDDEYGDRTGLWYKTMLKNMGLISYDDSHFDYDEVAKIVTRFLERDYEPDGRGGIVIFDRNEGDLRKYPLWDMQMRYLTQYIEKERAENE